MESDNIECGESIRSKIVTYSENVYVGISLLSTAGSIFPKDIKTSKDCRVLQHFHTHYIFSPS